MSKLKSFSGEGLIKLFSGLGFGVYTQKGSHIKLRRLKDSQKETLVIPNHKVIDKGTLRAILRQASKYIAIEKLNALFYSD
jgi:predicted RNA binding protein YcfA (HicA-like mRNA interferase family)